MSCQDFQSRLDDYIDDACHHEAGGHEDRRALEEHLSSCASCTAQLRELRSLRRASRELEREVPPSRDLWPEIAGRLQPRGTGASPTNAWGWVLAAGLVAAIVGLGLLLARPPRPADTAGSEAHAVAPAPDLPGASTQAAGRQLRASLERHRDRLPPETARQLENDVDLLEEAIGQIRSALREDPGSSRLHRLLASRYQTEMDLLRRIERL